MKIDIGKLEKGARIDKKLEGKVSLPESCGCANLSPIVRLDLSVCNSEGKYMLEGKAETEIEFICDRCLESFKKSIAFEMSEVYVRGVPSEESGELAAEGSIIDVEPALRSELLLNLPMRSLCKDDCKGLCYKCGRNLNISECGCDRTYVNPYFEDINLLFDGKEQ